MDLGGDGYGWVCDGEALDVINGREAGKGGAMSVEEKVAALRNRADEHDVAARVARAKARELRAAAGDLQRLAGLDAETLEARKGELVAIASRAAEESAADRVRAGVRGDGRTVPGWNSASG